MLHFLLGLVRFHKATLQSDLVCVYASHMRVKLSSYWSRVHLSTFLCHSLRWIGKFALRAYCGFIAVLAHANIYEYSCQSCSNISIYNCICSLLHLKVLPAFTLVLPCCLTLNILESLQVLACTSVTETEFLFPCNVSAIVWQNTLWLSLLQ